MALEKKFRTLIIIKFGLILLALIVAVGIGIYEGFVEEVSLNSEETDETDFPGPNE